MVTLNPIIYPWSLWQSIRAWRYIVNFAMQLKLNFWKVWTLHLTLTPLVPHAPFLFIILSKGYPITPSSNSSIASTCKPYSWKCYPTNFFLKISFFLLIFKIKTNSETPHDLAVFLFFLFKVNWCRIGGI